MFWTGVINDFCLKRWLTFHGYWNMSIRRFQFFFPGSDSCWCLHNLWLQTRTRKEGDLSSIVNEKIYFSREASRKQNRLPPPEREALAWCSVYMITYRIFTRTVLSNSFGLVVFSRNFPQIHASLVEHRMRLRVSASSWRVGIVV